jgi:Protein of unknown function (DUF3108)
VRSISKYILSFLILFLLGFSQLKSQCNLDNINFQFGEKATYQVYYNWAFIWLSAGEVYFHTNKKVIDKRTVYHFDSFGKSHKEYDWFFKVRDRFQSYVDSATFKPLYFHRSSSEGGYFVNNKYRYDHKNKLIYSSIESTRIPYYEDTVKMPECVFDVLSIIYYARNIDYNSYNIGDKIPITLIIDNEIYNLYIRYLGKEKIKTRNKEEFNCIKFRPLLVEGTIFSEGEHMNVWVTDDKNKVPVLVEAKILVGSIKAYLDTHEGTRYPLVPNN